MKTYKNVKCDVNVRIKIKKPRLFHVLLFDVDLTICKLNKRLIIFQMQSNIASKHATWMARYTMVVNKRLTSLRAVGFGSLVNIRDKINLETLEHAFLGKNWLLRYRRNTLVRCLYWRLPNKKRHNAKENIWLHAESGHQLVNCNLNFVTGPFYH